MDCTCYIIVVYWNLTSLLKLNTGHLVILEMPLLAHSMKLGLIQEDFLVVKKIKIRNVVLNKTKINLCVKKYDHLRLA